MIISPETIVRLLQQNAPRYREALEKKVLDGLTAREKRVFQWLFEQYRDENKRRWFDPYHILFSTDVALALASKEGLDRLIVSGIMLHDIGYFAVQDRSQFMSEKSRIVHMQEGAPLAARVLGENGYSPSEIEMTLGMIVVHDNPYLGIPIRGRERLGVRDCDRAWTMHIISFYNDLLIRYQGREPLPREFLLDRMVSFYGREYSLGDGWLVTAERVQQSSRQIEVPTYDFTRQQVEKKFRQRILELEKNVLSDAEIFGKYLSSQMELE